MYCTVTVMPSHTLVTYYENVLAELGLVAVVGVTHPERRRDEGLVRGRGLAQPHLHVSSWTYMYASTGLTSAARFSLSAQSLKTSQTRSKKFSPKTKRI